MMSGNNSNSGGGPDPNMVNTMYGTSKYGGEMFEDGGFVYIDSWLPFIM